MFLCLFTPLSDATVWRFSLGDSRNQLSEAERAPLPPESERSGTEDLAVKQTRDELTEVFRLQSLDEAEALRGSEEELSKERGHAPSWKKDAEEALKCGRSPSNAEEALKKAAEVPRDPYR